MKKVLIIDNKTTRVEEHSVIVNAVKKIDNVVWANTDDFIEYESFKEFDNIPEDFWNRFDLLMIHRSYANDIKKLVELQMAYDRKNKDVVFFSGGASPAPEYRVSEKTGKAFLYIEASKFYTPNLISFIKKYVAGESINLQYLNDGEKWGLSILLNSRRLIEQNGIKRFWEDGRHRDLLNENFSLFNSLYELYECVEYNDVKGAVEQTKLLVGEIDVDSMGLFLQTKAVQQIENNGRLQDTFMLDSCNGDEKKGEMITVFNSNAKTTIENLYLCELDKIIEKNLHR